jgi:tetraacyldisaccharide 4'-kinase
VVIFLVHWLQAQGKRVGVLSRGYRRRKHSPMALVSDGRQVLLGPDESGDEPFLIARRCPGAAVAVGDDRYQLGAWLLDQMALDCLVLDDGFQHRRLARNLDLLLVDASDPQGLDALLPVGRLREPMTAAARASAILITRVEEAHRLETVKKRFEAAHVPIRDPIGLRFVASGAVELNCPEAEPIGRLSGQRAVLCSGVAKPDSFRRLVETLDVKVLDELVWPDHHAYSRADLGRILERAMRLGADLVLTTEKDAVKLEPMLRATKMDCPFWSVRLGIDITSGQHRLDRVLLQTVNG